MQTKIENLSGDQYDADQWCVRLTAPTYLVLQAAVRAVEDLRLVAWTAYWENRDAEGFAIVVGIDPCHTASTKTGWIEQLTAAIA